MSRKCLVGLTEISVSECLVELYNKKVNVGTSSKHVVGDVSRCLAEFSRLSI